MRTSLRARWRRTWRCLLCMPRVPSLAQAHEQTRKHDQSIALAAAQPTSSEVPPELTLRSRALAQDYAARLEPVRSPALSVASPELCSGPDGPSLESRKPPKKLHGCQGPKGEGAATGGDEAPPPHRHSRRLSYTYPASTTVLTRKLAATAVRRAAAPVQHTRDDDSVGSISIGSFGGGSMGGHSFGGD